MNINSQTYDELLTEFSGNKRLVELIKWCILDWEESKELAYRTFGEYPDERNLLMKLKFDLINKKNELTGGN